MNDDGGAALMSARATSSLAMSQLYAAIEAMSDGCAVFDADDRIAFCNAAYRRANALIPGLLVPGTTFETILRENVRRGHFDFGADGSERFIARRLASHRNADAAFEYRLSTGHWHQVREHRLPDGGSLLLISDVTSRKDADTALARAAGELAASEQRFRDYADASADWFWETDAELRYTYMDDRSYTLINQPTQSRIGKRRDEITDIDLDKPHWQRHLADLAARRPFRDFRYRARTEDGVLRWISVSGKPIFDADGRFLGYRGAARDATEEMAAEARARELQTRLLEAIESFPDAFVAFDAEERLALCNRRYFEIYSGHADALQLGRKFEEMLRVGVARGDFPDAIGREEAFIVARLRQFRNPGAPIEQRLGDGRWLRITERRTADGGVTGVRSDITELKQREDRLRELVFRNAALVAAIDGLADAVVLFDADDRLVFWNRAYAEDFPRGEPLLTPGSRFTDMVRRALEIGVPQVPPDQRDAYAARRLAFHRAPDGVFDRQVADGRWQQLREHRLTDGSHLVMISDVTQHRHAEAQLHQAQKMEAVGQLTGGLAHDMNNLLGVVIGNLESAADRALDPQAREALADALAAAERGGELNRQLLAFARRQPLRPTRTNPNEVVAGMGRLAGRMIGETVRVRLDTGTDIWPVEIDRAQLESAILNLAVNARDAMPLGGRLTIATENVAVGERDHAAPIDLPRGDYVTISVADTGVGMPPDVVARVFEPFFTTKDTGQGSGLGLSQVYGFINQSHGRVRIDSAVGMGTVVTLYIPRAPGGELDAAGTQPGAAPAAAGSATVLVVDDNEELRQIAVRQIADMGYRVLEAPDAAHALELLGTGTPIDLLFTDIVLPGGIDGRALSWAARELRPKLKLLFTSGYADLEGGPEGPPDVEMLAKPYRRATLAHALQRVLAE